MFYYLDYEKTTYETGFSVTITYQCHFLLQMVVQYDW